ACGYKGVAEYDTIADVKSRITIPVIANGDIDSPQKARQVMAYTGVDAVMIGRAAQGQPWLFREINHYLQTGELMASPSPDEINQLLQQHLSNLYEFYGEFMGVRIARKHIGWYCKEHPEAEDFRKRINLVEEPRQQLEEVTAFFHNNWPSEAIKSAA
ncbi:MAG: tRNA dihydrouridine synthase DusB, partial [Gammaproteobacteria bacterium]